MQFKNYISTLISTLAPLIFTANASNALHAQQQTAAKCQKMARAIVGLNYHRSGSDDIKTGQIWRFQQENRLTMFSPDSFEAKPTKKLSEAKWKLELEDQTCALKISTMTEPSRTATYRITDTTWAIIDTAKWQKSGKGEEKFVPDLEDHSAMKTRFCGIGDRCEKLWK